MKERLMKEAKKAREKAYAPYSKFKVGAALYTKAQNIFHGSNIENASYSLTCCAERTAIFKAVSEGETAFEAIAVVADAEGPVSPCGACRQVMGEFFTDDVTIYLGNMNGEIVTTSIDKLLPDRFTL